MSDDDSTHKDADPEETVRQLKRQLVHLRHWFERERWKIEPQSRSFAPVDDMAEDGRAGGEAPDAAVKPPGPATRSPEGPAGSGS